MNDKNYTVYHLHSDCSLLDSCTKFYDYVDKAVELNQSAICFSEHGNIYNWVAKKMYCDKNNIKYIHGIEIYLTETLTEKVRDNFHTILIAKNYDGIKEINSLISVMTNREHMYYKPRLTFDEFLSLSSNILKISSCLASTLSKYRNNKETLAKLFKAYDYYEIQPHNSESQIAYNKMLYEASKKFNKPLIAGTDTHSLNKYKAECRSIIQKAKKIEYADEDKYDLTYKSYDELLNMFKLQDSLPMDVIIEAIENTNRMAESVESFELDTSIKYPKLYDNEEEVLKKRITKMLKYKIDNNIINKKNLSKYKDNIKEEMRVFKKINMVGYMLFMSELMCWCRENNILIGYARGSVAGSTIAYILDITDVDPMVWNTIFSRFANEDREEVGDVDIDISPEQRDLVYQHIIDLYGMDKTSYILAMGTLSDKGAIDEIGRALEMPLDVVEKIKTTYSTLKDNIDACKKRIKDIENINGFQNIKDVNTDALKSHEYYTLKCEYDNKKEILSSYIDSMEKFKNGEYKNLFYYFDGINGVNVSQSCHPAGIVISPITIPDNFGYFFDKDGKHIMCVNMEEIHDGTGLVKYDLLALKNIEIIRKTCEYAKIPYPESHLLNWNDKNVWDDIIINSAGIFQFESPYAFQMLKNYKPQCINDLSIVNASLRPSGESYRDNLLARKPNHNPSKIIDDLLADNNGYLVFQEDTIKFLQNICGLSGSEADNVRRAIGRKQLDRLQKALPKILEGYCKMSSQPREIAEEEAKQFLKIIEDSANYQFGYNHSTGYSMIGYTCAYYRYYYPLEFVTAYLNCADKQEDILSGTELAKLKNIEIKPIQYGKSGAYYTFDKSTNSIYQGISSIKYLNTTIANELLDISKEKHKNFLELLKDIKSKTKVNSRQLDILIGLDFFKEFGKSKYLMDVVEIYNNYGTIKQINKSKLSELNLDIEVIEKYSHNITKAQYRDIDNQGLMEYLIKQLPDKELSIKEICKKQKEYMGYVHSVFNKLDDDYYIIVEYKTYKDASKPYLTLRQLNNGYELKTKIKNKRIYEENPFGEYSILKINTFTEDFKVRKNSDGKWEKTEEKEYILEEYEVIN